MLRMLIVYACLLLFLYNLSHDSHCHNFEENSFASWLDCFFLCFGQAARIALDARVAQGLALGDDVDEVVGSSQRTTEQWGPAQENNQQ